MTNFAPPLKKLAESGIGNTAYPAGGQGLVLTPDGKLPTGLIPDSEITSAKILDGTIALADLSFFPMVKVFDGNFSGVTTLNTGTLTLPTGAIGLRVAFDLALVSGGTTSMQGRFSNKSGATDYAYISMTNWATDAANVDGQTQYRLGTASSGNASQGFIELPQANTSSPDKAFFVQGMHENNSVRYCAGSLHDTNPISSVQIITAANVQAGARVTVWAY